MFWKVIEFYVASSWIFSFSSHPTWVLVCWFGFRLLSTVFSSFTSLHSLKVIIKTLRRISNLTFSLQLFRPLLIPSLESTSDERWNLNLTSFSKKQINLEQYIFVELHSEIGLLRWKFKFPCEYLSGWLLRVGWWHGK